MSIATFAIPTGLRSKSGWKSCGNGACRRTKKKPQRGKAFSRPFYSGGFVRSLCAFQIGRTILRILFSATVRLMSLWGVSVSGSLFHWRLPTSGPANGSGVEERFLAPKGMALLCQSRRPRLGYSTNTHKQLTFDGLPPRRWFRSWEVILTLELGPFGAASHEQLLGGALLGRTSQKLWPIESGAFRH